MSPNSNASPARSPAGTPILRWHRTRLTNAATEGTNLVTKTSRDSASGAGTSTTVDSGSSCANAVIAQMAIGHYRTDGSVEHIALDDLTSGLDAMDSSSVPRTST